MADNLFTALQMFQNGAKEFALSRAIANANEQVQVAKAQLSNEQEQRAALQQISNGLVAQMAGMGAPATTIQAVAGAMGPKQFATADQAILEGALSGNQNLMQAGMQADRASTANNMALYEKKAAIDEATQKRLFEHQMELAALRANKDTKAKLSSEDTAFATNIQVGRELLGQLKKAVTRSGTWESRWGNAGDSATLDGAPYNFAITFSKIVDPNSVAREGEVNAAMKYLLNLGPTSSKAVTMAQLKTLDGYLTRYEKARALAQKKGLESVTVGGTTYHAASDPLKAQQPQGPAAPAAKPAGFDISKYIK